MAVPTAGAVRAARAATRARRAPADWYDRYFRVFGVAVLVVLLLGPFHTVLTRLAEPLAAADPAAARAGLALLVAYFAGLVALASLAGPVVLSPADARWLLLSPLDRRAVLAPAARRAAALGVVAGAPTAAVAVRLLGMPDHGPLRLGATVLIGAAAGLAAVCLATLAQPSAPATRRLRRVALAVTAAAVLTAAAPLLPPPGSIVTAGTPSTSISPAAAEPAAGAPTGAATRRVVQAATVVDDSAPRAGSLPAVPLSGLLPAAGLAVAVALVLALLVWRRLAGFPAGPVADAAGRVGVATETAVGLEPSFLTRAVEQAYWRGRRLRSRRWPSWPGPLALAWLDWRVLARRPLRPLALAGATALPAVLVTVWPAQAPVAVVASFVLALAAASAGSGGARHDADSPALSRLFGVRQPAADAARLALPSVLAAAWYAVALALLARAGALPAGPWALFGPAAAPVLAVAASRLARRGHVDHASTPVVMPMTGSHIPTGWFIWGLTGLDMAVLGCLPLLWALAARPADPYPMLLVQVIVSGAVVAVHLLRRRTR
ncbi:hypothetical protein CS0771_74880 [Catellatospora sp. IY07-71]|uniref:DUF6297 family protein n=1 Tax=Catellatospora sp. IY07-71 TaxID=2728827 RepID=UPI001BB3F1BC|nr:DUF6297 family protein [Catellatospora sp. IY07-71]BCJ77944.1 hypothetical protein CS0771_74880 [Catellatospora sp. IY07-71]